MLKTIKNARAYCVIGLMNDLNEPTFEGVKEDLIDVMLQQEEDQSLQEGVADGLLTYLRALADDDCELLDGHAAEKAMIDAYIHGQAMVFGGENTLRISEQVRGGNSGWWWPEAITYLKDTGAYPLALCEHYGLMLGYKHALESKAMAEYVKKQHQSTITT